MGEAKEQDHLEHRYHLTTDQLLSGMEFRDTESGMFGYKLGAQAASQIDLVGWLPGEEFDLVRRESRASERKGPLHKGIKPRKPQP